MCVCGGGGSADREKDNDIIITSSESDASCPPPHASLVVELLVELSALTMHTMATLMLTRRA